MNRLDHAWERASKCASKSLSVELETFAIDRIKAYLLTENHLQELVWLTNEEIAQSRDTYQDRLKAIEGQLEEVQSRLHKLYDALETGKLA